MQVDLETQTKRCYACSNKKPLSEFYRNRSRVDGHSDECKLCNKAKRKAYMSANVEKCNAYSKKWKAENPEKTRLYSKRAQIKWRYGITYDEYEAILARGCAICGDTENLHLDHCHSTGKVRAALCRDHNLMLGHAKDDPDALRAAADYLEHHRGK